MMGVVEVGLMAQSLTDSLSVKVCFPLGGSRLMFHGNQGQALRQFAARLDSLSLRQVGGKWRVAVTASTSPEGSLSVNKRLAHRRAEAVCVFLHRHALSLKDTTATAGWLVDEVTTNHLRRQTPRSAFAAMRFAEVRLWPEPSLSFVGAAIKPVPMLPDDGLKMTDADVVAPTPLPEARRWRPMLLVKTNLVYDMLTAVNVSVEVPIVRRWSAQATLIHPWWRKTKWHKTLQMRYVALQPRYYFTGSQTTDRSLFVGLNVGVGHYDFQLTRRGVQGDGWHVSPVVGGVKRLTRHWRLEYAASAGYVQTDYTQYTHTSGTPYGTIKVKDYPWGSKRLRTVVPTSIELSLVYVMGRKTRGGHHGL